MVKKVLEIFRKESLFLKLKKCWFEQQSIEFLGYQINGDRLKIDPAKVKGISEWLMTLKNIEEV